MLVKLDITDCKTQKEIDDKIERHYPYAGYMPTLIMIQESDGKKTATLDVLRS